MNPQKINRGNLKTTLLQQKKVVAMQREISKLHLSFTLLLLIHEKVRGDRRRKKKKY